MTPDVSTGPAIRGGMQKPMTAMERLAEAMACEQCRRYRIGVLVMLALLAVTWLLG